MNTHTAQWLEIAEAYETPPSRRNPKQYRLASNGLCVALCQYDPKTRKPYFSDDFDLTMQHLLNLVETDDDHILGWWWPYFGGAGWTRDCDFERATFACFMAALSDKDIETMSEV